MISNYDEEIQKHSPSYIDKFEDEEDEEFDEMARKEMIGIGLTEDEAERELEDWHESKL